MSGLFGLIFPDDCRVCKKPLTDIARYPVCSSCLAQPKPLKADHFCSACRTPFASAFPLDENGLCGLCRRGMRGFDCAYSYGFYEGPLQELIHLLKYQGIETLAGPLGRYLMAALPRDERVDLIVPVPMHWWRKWRRGFNQSELLAQAVAREAGIPFADAMRRTRNTPPQAGLSDHERRHNLTGAFSVPAKRRVEGRRVLLIDDVMTTGATTSACGAALLRAGAERVLVLTVARADRRIASPAPRARAKSNDAGGW